MAGYEWKKLLRYRRGGWIVLVLLLAELASILLFTRPFDRNLEENRSVYNEYLAQVEGPLTPEKRAAHCLRCVGHAPVGLSKRGRDTESDADIRPEEMLTFFSNEYSIRISS